MNDSFGDRMKGYEDSSRFEPCLPIVVRIDGKSFHTYTRKFDRPWDEAMVSAMQATTEFLMEQTSAKIGYTQSDEITLILHSDEPKSQVFFDGKVQKIVSVTAAMASVCFNRAMAARSYKILDPAYFDSRAYTVPDKMEASNVLLWRELDAVRNSVSMMAHHYFGHNALRGKSVPEMKSMLTAVNKSWEYAPRSFTHGTHYVRSQVELLLTDEELARIPEKYRPLPELLVKRNIVQRVDRMPGTAEERIALIFGAPPLLEGAPT